MNFCSSKDTTVKYKSYKLAKGICNTITNKELVFTIYKELPEIKTKLSNRKTEKKKRHFTENTNGLRE